MPYDLCRHIMPTGHHCNVPAAGKKQLYCYFHQRQHTLTDRPKRPCSVRLNLQFPEDRAAIQLNFHIVQLAITEGRLDPRQAQAIIQANRAAAANLKTGPLNPRSLKHRVERVILTPDEKEVAPARQACLPDEELTHGPDCPCGYCAERHRSAPGESHHADCTCGLCHEEVEVQEDAESPESEDARENQAENSNTVESLTRKIAEAQTVEEFVALYDALRAATLAEQEKNAASSHPPTPEGPQPEQREESAFPPAHLQTMGAPFVAGSEAISDEWERSNSDPPANGTILKDVRAATASESLPRVKRREPAVKNDVILSEVCRETANEVEGPAVPPAQPQNHASPHPPAPEGCRSERAEPGSPRTGLRPWGGKRSEESAVPPKPPTKYSFQRINPATSPESIIYDRFSENTNLPTGS